MMEILKSIDGRFFGRDSDGFHRAFNGLKAPELKIGVAGSEVSIYGGSAQAALAATTGTTLTAGGTITLNSSIAKTYTLGAPQVNVPVRIYSVASTTQTVNVTGTIQTTVGSTANVITF